MNYISNDTDRCQNVERYTLLSLNYSRAENKQFVPAVCLNVAVTSTKHLSISEMVFVQRG
jgi:hypothetical protein